MECGSHFVEDGFKILGVKFDAEYDGTTDLLNAVPKVPILGHYSALNGHLGAF